MNWIRQIVLHNLGLKALSVLLAALVWHQVTSREVIQRSQRTISLPLTFVNIPPNTEVLPNDSDRRVDVFLQSDRGSLVLDERNLAVVVDLKPYRLGEEHSIQLGASNIVRPSGVDFVGIKPQRVRLKLEATRRQSVIVEPLVLGEPTSNSEITAVEVRPAEITIVGPESQVLEITSVPTDPVDASGRSATFEQTTFVDLEGNPRLRIDNSSEVTVRVVIEEKRRNARLRGIKIIVVPEASRARIEPNQLELEGTVPVSFSEKLDAKAFQAIIDVSDLEIRREPYEISPRIVVPPQYESIFRLSKLTPAQIQVRRTR